MTVPAMTVPAMTVPAVGVPADGVPMVMRMIIGRVLVPGHRGPFVDAWGRRQGGDFLQSK
ncbi:hypothetical protein [Kitasatospora sp. NPDC059327]|uniref:hypothetical protein n=1 Tax=Kitasatospora sp. NPDC059327 TaxID=3346803 RepID=UPI0036ACE50C